MNVYPDLSLHPIKELLQAGVKVTVNSDDPAYFGGYVNENYRAVIDALMLSDVEVLKLLENSFASGFVTPSERKAMLESLHQYWRASAH